MARRLSKREIRKSLEPYIRKVLDDVAKFTQRQAKRLCPVDTGALRRSIRRRKTGKYSRRVTAHQHYAAWVEFGRGPVRPKRRKWLRYYRYGRVIFSKYSRLSRPRLFFKRAAEIGQAYADSITKRR